MRFDSFAWKRSSPLHAAVSTVLLVGLAQSAGAQGGVYQENNGLIVVEIESTPAVDLYVCSSPCQPSDGAARARSR